MICLRCGKCCLHLDIHIINPRSILANGTIDPEDPFSIVLKKAGETCPHLVFQEGLAICIVHHMLCYQGTPCQQFEQIGPDDAVCCMSGYFKAIDHQE
jgi:hypothetical protein